MTTSSFEIEGGEKCHEERDSDTEVCSSLPPTDLNLSRTGSSMNHCWLCCVCLTVLVGSVVLTYLDFGDELNQIISSRSWNEATGLKGSKESSQASVQNLVPKDLIGLTYFESDFSNDAGVVPTYWNCSRVPGECNKKRKTWGPCYPDEKKKHVSWVKRVENQARTHIPVYHPPRYYKQTDDSVEGYCRPGFVILGAGKCGTSSLYHYLTDHPRVLPASEKQIHYFKYYTKRPMKWYLAHFPTTASFLASGALMTGEASPGYLPYPNVAPLMANRMPGSRLIVVGREPIERMYSSFMYSYTYPLIDLMKRGRIPGIPLDLSDEEYEEKFLFSFEEMMQAELKVLKKCLAPDGDAIVRAKSIYGDQTAWKKAYHERAKQDLPPLADLDSFCYGKKVNKTVLRPQWAELVAQYPQKVIHDKNTHLLQSHLGRSIYALPMEWWYAHFDANDIFFLCTEEMKDLSGQGLEPLRQWLGLPEFNFSHTLQQGAYNVGGHRGYDKELSWHKITQENASGAFSPSTVIPLSSELRAEIQAFLDPYNERLFQLVGKRCQW